MSENANSEEPKRKESGADLIIPVAGIAFVIYYFTTIWNAPWTAQVSAFFIGSVLVLLSCIYFVVFALRWKEGNASFDFSKIYAPAGAVPKRLALLGLTIAYIVVIEWVGFIITTFAFLAGAMLVLSEGKNKKFIVSLSAALAIGGYLLFVVAFQRRFPDGLIEHWLKPFWYATGIWQ